MIERCTVCVIPASFPGVTFDNRGVCSICQKFEAQKEYIPSSALLKHRLLEIIDEARSKKLKYDAVTAFSGGKDSTFLLYILKKEYHLNMLAVTLDNGFMSEHSFKNMRIVLDHLDIDHLIIKPCSGLMKEIFRECIISDIYPEHLTNYGSAICISCIRMVNNMCLRTAIEKNIPLVMLGNSPGQLIQSENEIIYQDNKIPYPLRKRLFKSLADKIGENVYYYLMLGQKEYKTEPFPYIINPYPLIGYNEEEIYRTIDKLGWKKPDDVDPHSTNCRLNSLGIVVHKERLNFHPYDYEMSMLVRLGILSRDQALRRVEDSEGKALELAKEIRGEIMS
ncbi:MAG: hypothetical protein JXB88_23085 [Spirochaetales bacterium]|nr:hypothetical protein [Spirochaetales bacterium]